MDTTNCMEGYATDVAFQSLEQAEPCGTSLVAFWSTIGTVMIVRFITACKQAKNWHNTNIKLKRKGRFPFTPSLSFLFLLLIFISFVLIGTNIANVSNGFAWMTYSLGLVPYFIQTTFVLFRFVALGERIIPLGRDFGVQRSGKSSLRSMSNGGRFLAFTQLTCALISTMVFCIIDPLDPANHDIHATIGLTLKGQFQLAMGLGVMYQLYRCVLVVKVMQRNMQDHNSSELMKRQTLESIQKMNRRIIFAFVMSLSSSLGYWLVAARALPRSIWWVFLFPAASEAVYAFFVEFVIPHRRGENKNTRSIKIDKVTASSSNPSHIPGCNAAAVIVTVPSG